MGVTRMVVGVIALLEALCWATAVRMIFGAPTWTAVVVGIAVFVLVWCLDAQMVLLDFGLQPSDGHGDTPVGIHRFISRAWKARRIVMAFVFRMFIVLFSAGVTAPMAAQLILFRDAREAIKQGGAEVKAGILKEEGERFSRLIADAEKKVERRRKEYLDEINGLAGTLKKGMGPVGTFLAHQLSEAETQLTLVRKEESDFRASAEGATPAEVAARFGRKVPELTPIAELKKANELREQDPQHKRAALLAEAVVIMLFAILCILKLLQMPRVSHYLSDSLQELWARYKGGAFDERLGADRHFGARGELALLELAWWWRKNVEEDQETEAQREVNREIASINAALADLENMRKGMKSLETDADERLVQKKKVAAAMNLQKEAESSRLDATARELGRVQASIDSNDRATPRSVETLRLEDALRRDEERLEQTVVERRANVSNARDAEAEARGTCSRLEADLVDLRDQLATIDGEIRSRRKDLFRLYSARAQRQAPTSNEDSASQENVRSATRR